MWTNHLRKLFYYYYLFFFFALEFAQKKGKELRKILQLAEQWWGPGWDYDAVRIRMHWPDAQVLLERKKKGPIY